jgi:predicted ester cyclase
MTIEDNKAVSRRVIAALNARDWNALSDVMAPDLAERFADSPFLRAFPDIRTSIEEQIAEGDRVVTHWINRGTHQAAFCGAAPTGRPIEYSGMSIDRIEGGRVVRNYGQADLLGLLEQIGAVRLPDQR